MKTDLFQSCGHCWVFQICWHIECSTFTASSFRIWNSSTGILSPLLALFIVMLSKAHLTSHSRMSGSRSVITPSWLSGSWTLAKEMISLRNLTWLILFHFVVVSYCLVTKLYPTLCDPWTIARQAPLSMGFFRQQYWRRMPFPFPGDLPDSGIKPKSLALQADSLPLTHQGSPIPLCISL